MTLSDDEIFAIVAIMAQYNLPFHRKVAQLCREVLAARRAVPLVTELLELTAGLHDEGPEGEGWQSDELRDVRHKLYDMIDQLKARNGEG